MKVTAAPVHRAFTAGVILCGLLFSETASAEFAKQLPHAPNFVGRNMCLGIERPAPRGSQSAPILRTTWTQGTEKAEHEIVISSTDSIVVTEDLVDAEACRGLPLNTARWARNGTAEFCLSAWDKGKYVKVRLRASYVLSADKRSTLATLYAVGACKLGESPNAPSYGDVLKKDNGIPVFLPDE